MNLSVIIAMRAYLLVNIKIVLYCDDWFVEWHMNLRQRGLDNYAEGVSKHLNRTIRHSIVLKWVNEIILP